MAGECKRGQWSLIRGDGKRFIACRDYLGIGPAEYAADFWATSEDGHAQVFRSSLGTQEICRFDYFCGTFEIAFDVIGVADLNVMSSEQKEYLAKTEAQLDPNSPCKIFGQEPVSWIEAITQEQFDRFLSDIKDPDLYLCLTECVPPINPPSKPWSYGYEKPSRSFGSPIIPLFSNGQNTFSFIGGWLAGKMLLPKADRFAFKWKLSEPVRKIRSKSESKD